ncbi:MAG: phosphate signaling complex protein PhoU [Pseudomonadota bacterium]|nr:phosphate signaling complex protein PhoU [Pseudomonadota bacterium]
MALVSDSHTVHRFDEEINRIAELVDRMGELANDQLRRAVETLRNEDPATAHEVITRDREINELDVEIDDLIIHLIAKRQPMAKDLREIVTLGKLVTELERAGDEARKIAGLTIHFYEGGTQPPSDHILRDIYSMTGYAGDMMEQSMKAFSSLDVNQALNVLKMNEDLESEFGSVLRRLSTFIMEDSRNVGHFVEIVLGIRALERFGGRAKNIAGHVIFLAKGHDVRHERMEDIINLIQ